MNNIPDGNITLINQRSVCDDLPVRILHVLRPSCPPSFMSSVLHILRPSNPPSFMPSVLHVLHPSCPPSLSSVLHVLHSSCPPFFMSSVLHVLCSYSDATSSFYPPLPFIFSPSILIFFYRSVPFPVFLFLL